MADDDVRLPDNWPADAPVLSSMEELVESMWQGDNGGFDPDRPFDGQAHTDEGERGKTRVDLRFRDVADCIGIGFLLACGYSDLRASASTWNDVYEALRKADFDPRAVCQNAMCEMERRMGIFPNIPAPRPESGGDAP